MFLRYFVINELDSKGENLKVRYYEEDPLVSFVPTGIIIYKASSQGELQMGYILHTLCQQVNLVTFSCSMLT